MHSLSWHRKGERSINGRYYARIWTPEDPRMHLKNMHHSALVGSSSGASYNGGIL